MAGTKPNRGPHMGSIAERLERINADMLIARALRKCEPGNRRGTPSGCWKIDPVTRFEAAKMHIVGHQSAACVRDALAEHFDRAKVTTRQLSTWLRTVRQCYGQLHDAYLAEIESSEALAFKDGDLLAVMAITISKLAPKFIQYGTQLEFAGAENKELHLLLRFLGTQIDAAKVQAEARRAEAQTANIISKIRDASAEGQRAGRDPGEALKSIGTLIDELMGLGGGGVAAAVKAGGEA